MKLSGSYGLFYFEFQEHQCTSLEVLDLGNNGLGSEGERENVTRPTCLSGPKDFCDRGKCGDTSRYDK